MNRHIKHCFKSQIPSSGTGSLSLASEESAVFVASDGSWATPASCASYLSGICRSMASDKWAASHASDVVSLEW
jgi:hypothetical protein